MVLVSFALKKLNEGEVSILDIFTFDENDPFLNEIFSNKKPKKIRMMIL